ncbi:hypothetical protein Clacol_003277 [Clathrus columnatus]|uniref:Uncharacterized protein n=1 Tax=Clathrus columnatus TaxID=1419009 RepID=A0AAV5AAU5_9AGAM|nr:hypothetical protein Clacol_003277 [Clathrus columnatus]
MKIVPYSFSPAHPPVVFSPTSPSLPCTPMVGELDTELNTQIDPHLDLDNQAHSVCEKIRNKYEADKSTQATYARYIKDYECWWNQYECEKMKKDASYKPLSAYPILPRPPGTALDIRFKEVDSTKSKMILSSL